MAGTIGRTGTRGLRGAVVVALIPQGGTRLQSLDERDQGFVTEVNEQTNWRKR